MRPQYRRFGFVDFDAMAVLPSSEDDDQFVCRRGNGDNVVVTRADIIAGAGSVPDPLLLGAGTVGAPTYSFTASPNTGVFSPAVDQLGLAAQGNEGLRISGLITPAITLFGQTRTVDGSVGAPSYSFTSDAGTGIFLAAPNELGFAANFVEIVRAKETIGENQFIISPGVVQNNAAFPILAFGDGDSGFYENADDNITLALASQARWRWNSVLFRAVATDGPQIQNASGVSSTVPVILPVQSDVNTGFAADGFDGIRAICGGVQAIFYKESFDHILITNEVHTGLTASTTQTQAGGLGLLSAFNNISTVANANDAATVFAAALGKNITIMNSGANTLQVFPALGDDLGAGVNTSITIAAGASKSFMGLDTTNWQQVASG